MDKSSLFLVVAWLTSSLLAAALCSGWLIRRILIFLVQTGALTAQRCGKQKDDPVLDPSQHLCCRSGSQEDIHRILRRFLNGDVSFFTPLPVSSITLS